MIFVADSDSSAKPSYPHVANVLNNGVAALLYSGDRDFICNVRYRRRNYTIMLTAFHAQWLGNQQWVEQLEWSGADEFRKTSLAPWYGKAGAKDLAGKYRTFGNLTFATVHDSGHFVPVGLGMLSLDRRLTALPARQARRVAQYGKCMASLRPSGVSGYA
jgi:cathepsin A (carboxypeptidase C)